MPGRGQEAVANLFYSSGAPTPPVAVFCFYDLSPLLVFLRFFGLGQYMMAEHMCCGASPAVVLTTMSRRRSASCATPSCGRNKMAVLNFVIGAWRFGTLTRGSWARDTDESAQTTATRQTLGLHLA